MLPGNRHVDSKHRGLTLIDLMIMVAIIGILSGMAIPRFIGMQTSTRNTSVRESALCTISDIEKWMMVVNEKEPGIIDFDGNGEINPADDAILANMSIADIPAQWDVAHGPAGGNDQSPFGDTDGDGIGEPLFNSTAVAGSGQIAVACAGTACTLVGYSQRANDFPIITKAVTID